MGIVGLCVFLWFLLSLFRGTRRILKREIQPELLALLLPAILYSITFQATEGTFLSFTWVHLGLVGCAISLFEKPALHIHEGASSSANP
jgi:O-antigen ligase